MKSSIQEKKKEIKLSCRDIFAAPDFIIAVLLVIVLWKYMPTCITCAFSIGVYEIGISVLSIVFSLFLASSAIIVSSTDNDFILFIEVDTDKKKDLGAYSTLISTSIFTLCSLLIALIYSITVFILTSHALSINETCMQSKWVFIIFVFLFTYSLLATALAVIASFLFAMKRVDYLKFINRK